MKLQRTISHCTYSSVNRSSKNLKRNERKIIQHFSGRQSRTACRNEINSASRDEFNKVAAAAATGHHIACLPSPPLPFLLPLAALSGHPLTSGLWSVWLRLWLPDFPVEWCRTAHTIHSTRAQLNTQHTFTVHTTQTAHVYAQYTHNVRTHNTARRTALNQIKLYKLILIFSHLNYSFVSQLLARYLSNPNFPKFLLICSLYRQKQVRKLPCISTL